FVTSVPYLMKGYFSALVHDVYQFEDLTPEVVDLKQMRYFGALSAQYSALYGKMEFYGYLIDYDFYVLAGFGMVATAETCTTPDEGDCGPDEGNGRGFRTPDDTSDHWKVSGNLGGGARFYFRDWIGLRVEVRDIAYADRAVDPEGITTDIRNHVLFVLGVSFLL
ncbi:MAG: outer membrane beta-barrel domain-containing protein, partial [Deltaproteobacteria bacterium]|nr:outer membrane beta-barrel domain-containing protein [Deltaproteobacteria bacterium]